MSITQEEEEAIEFKQWLTQCVFLLRLRIWLLVSDPDSSWLVIPRQPQRRSRMERAAQGGGVRHKIWWTCDERHEQRAAHLIPISLVPARDALRGPMTTTGSFRWLCFCVGGCFGGQLIQSRRRTVVSTWISYRNLHILHRIWSRVGGKNESRERMCPGSYTLLRTHAGGEVRSRRWHGRCIFSPCALQLLQPVHTARRLASRPEILRLAVCTPESLAPEGAGVQKLDLVPSL